MPQNCYFSAKQNAKRLHGGSLGFTSMYSPTDHVVSNTMVKRTKNKKQSSSARVASLEKKITALSLSKQGKKKATPFGDTGSMIGSKLGGMFGNSSMGSGIGRWLGTGIGSIFGSGDYHLNGEKPKYNVLTNGSQIPKFNTGMQTNIVSHREYLGDIMGTSAFTNRTYPLNPGMAQTFPWLATVAQNYQEYIFHGLIFEFRPLITDFVTGGAPGVVVMSTNYNSGALNYANKQQMENAEYAVSVKPTLGLMHGIECDPNQTPFKEKFIRSTVVPSGQDSRLYDLGTFQFATQNNPIQNLGELWVSYCVEFLKPILPSNPILSSTHLTRTSVTSAAPLGTSVISGLGLLGATATAVAVTWTGSPGINYLVNINWDGTANAAVTVPTFTTSGLAFLPWYNSDTLNSQVIPLSGATTNILAFNAVVLCNLTSPGTVTLGCTTNSGTFPAGCVVDIFVTPLDSTITA